ncbi:MAG: cysteine desulfurase family protein [Actinomycetota bacterium]|nr:cysteine desulfurase [Actinomycetota bacterium]
MDEIYLDHASTTRPHPAAIEAMSGAADLFADPARLYGAARRARMALDDARARIALALSGRPEEIVFTSGGTESCNLAVVAAALAARAARKPPRVVVSAIEHTAVLEAARSLDGFEVIELPVSSSGITDLDALRDAMPAGVVSIQTANQEIGTMQDVAAAASIARSAGALFHTDACMTVGNVPSSVAGVDLLSASAHKFYGPKGAGFLWVRRGVRVRPMLVGDDRERHRRAGLENLPAIMGMAAALEARLAEIPTEVPRLFELSSRLRTALPSLIPDVVVHGDPSSCLPGLVAFSVPHIEGESLVLLLDAKGIGVHSGSSCTSTPTEPSHVLAAIGARTHGSLRVSFGRSSRDADADALLRELPVVVEQLWRAAPA